MTTSNIIISSPLAIVMVGLPARGKTYISKKLARYLNWIGVETKVFNVGEYRRKAVDQSMSTSDFFSPDNDDAKQIRRKCALKALGDMCQWLKTGEVAVYDATNSSLERREMIINFVSSYNIKTFFIESICSDQHIIDANIREVKVYSPDYKNKNPDEAIKDFRKRIDQYNKQYETINEEKERELSFIKIINQGEKYIVNRVQGHLESRVVYYLTNIHVLPRTIYLTRHGEAKMNVKGQIGRESDLTRRGKMFAKTLANFLVNEYKDKPSPRIWTSLLRQTTQTSKEIPFNIEHWKALDEIDSGVCDGMTYEEIQEKFPDVYNGREKHKFHYRYPGGESYQDLVARLEPVILQLERQEDIVVIASQAVCRCLLAYFQDKNLEELPYLNVPLHTVFKLIPLAYGCHVEEIKLPPEPTVDTYRPKTSLAVSLTKEEKRARGRQNSECTEPSCCGKGEARGSPCGEEGEEGEEERAGKDK